MIELHALLARASEYVAKVRPTTFNCEVSFDCVLFAVQRHGCHLWWRAQCIDSALGLGAIARGKPPSWSVHRYWSVWHAWASELKLERCFAKGGVDHAATIAD